MAERKPNLISKIPEGIDLFPSNAPKHTADMISQVLNKGEMHVIGLDGAWGSGKSNILKMVQKDWTSTNGNLMLTYDVWGHMEEAQRNSILSEIVEVVSKDKKHSRHVLQEQLKELEGRRVETTTKSIPRLHAGLVISLLVLFMSPLLNYLVGYFNKLSFGWTIFLLLLPFLFVVAVLVGSVMWHRVKDERWEGYRSAIGKFLSIYNDKELDQTKIEYSNASEATVADFHKFMQTVSKELSFSKLVIVLDNIDRLPYSKIFECWSVINTFFPEEPLSNIYVIVAFDRNQVLEAFSSELRDKSNDDEIGNDYINKTFDIVFRVAPPMISDWKKIFRAFWEQAYGVGDSNKDELRKIERVFELTEKNITPRNMISFINEIVVMDLSRNGDVPLEYMAIMAAKRHSLIHDPLITILDHSYLGSLDYLYKNDEDLDRNISALFYQVESGNVFSVVYTSQLKSAFDNFNTRDLKLISRSDCFEEIIDCVLMDVNNIENSIRSLEFVDNERGVYDISYWNILYSYHSNDIVLDLPEIPDYVITLLESIDPKFADELLQKIFYEVYAKKIDPVSLKSIVDKLASANLGEIDILVYLQNMNVSPDLFLQFLSAAGKYYLYYKVDCDFKELDEYISQKVFSNIFEYKGLEFYEKGTELKKSLAKIESNLDFLFNNLDKSCSVFKFYNRFHKYLCERIIPYQNNVVVLADDWTHIKDDDTKIMVAAMRIALIVVTGFSCSSNVSTFDGIACSESAYDLLPSVDNVSGELIHYMYGQDLFEVVYNSNAVKYSSYIKDVILCALRMDSFLLRDNDKIEYYQHFNDMCTQLNLNGVQFFPIFANKVKQLDLFTDDDYIEAYCKDELMRAVYFHRDTISLAQCVYDRVYSLLKNLGAYEWKSSIEDFNEFGFSQAIELNFDVSSNAIDGFKLYLFSVHDNNANLIGDNLDKVIDYIESNSPVDVSTIFIEFRNQYTNNLWQMSAHVFLQMADYLFKYAKLDEQGACRGFLNRSIAANNSCLQIILNHKDKIIDLYNKEPEEFGVFLTALYERKNEELAVVDSVIEIFDKQKT